MSVEDVEDVECGITNSIVFIMHCTKISNNIVNYIRMMHIAVCTCVLTTSKYTDVPTKTTTIQI
ncbi:hypothetical protein BMR1_02g02180 [Babesia microti strain RI]|uniref:Uncharacterized protein n=1 Tax=Babesia microti (strain RI) TaxID=1133968 RepID=I7JA38_BABMR|nr:LOW QUALITY PROTEIN: hypothetical protein BMR1_02g02180 [Babesia microti strain RI]CCF73594.1 hypothetical protein BMR1_02g02180 [Babesia microti strain RI]|eukprot:XP_012648203.1 LOW QUALITY PROTEIN: hypothetical protein BMR1_02g02180 [Babesia microti strain RI]